ncbi:hypothetical protein D3C72_1865770 [compost metagenome]
MAAAHHGKAVGMVKVAAARQQRHGLLAGVGQVVVFFASRRGGAHAKDAVFRLQNHFAVFGDVVGNSGRLPDAEVDVGAVMNILRHACGQLVLGAFLVAAHGVISCAAADQAACLMPTACVATRSILITWLT